MQTVHSPVGYISYRYWFVGRLEEWSPYINARKRFLPCFYTITISYYEQTGHLANCLRDRKYLNFEKYNKDLIVFRLSDFISFSQSELQTLHYELFV